MKVLFQVNYPLAWARGGHAVQIRETEKELSGWALRWSGCILKRRMLPGEDFHLWSFRPTIFIGNWQDGEGSKSSFSGQNPFAAMRGRLSQSAKAAFGHCLPWLLGKGLYSMLGLEVYRRCDALLAINPAEAEYMIRVHGADRARTHVVPCGVSPVFLDASVKPQPFKGLLYVGYISRVKNSVRVARAAKAAQCR